MCLVTHCFSVMSQSSSSKGKFNLTGRKIIIAFVNMHAAHKYL